MADSLWRARNAARRLLAGLPPRNAPPSPEAPTDVFRTVASIYRFAAGHVAGATVLDWGCGAGFGSALLARSGARAVVGVDPDDSSIRHARKRYGGSAAAGAAVDFRVAPLDDPASGWPPERGPVERLVAVASLGRLADPEAALPRVAGALAPDGALVASLPPILDGPTLELHRARHPEAARLFLWDWADLLGRTFRELRVFSHQPPAGARLDLASPRPSTLDEAAFRFDEIPLDDLDNVGTLGALFVCRGPRA